MVNKGQFNKLYKRAMWKCFHHFLALIPPLPICWMRTRQEWERNKLNKQQHDIWNILKCDFPKATWPAEVEAQEKGSVCYTRWPLSCLLLVQWLWWLHSSCPSTWFSRRCMVLPCVAFGELGWQQQRICWQPILLPSSLGDPRELFPWFLQQTQSPS